MVAAAVVGSAVVGAVGSSVAANQQKKAAQRAGDAQTQAAYAQLDQQQAQFDKIRELLQPWVTSGTQANSQLGTLLGLNGSPAQDEAIMNIQRSGLYTSQLNAGENAIRQNAAATGGLRGGNTQAALGRFAPTLLAQTIQGQIANLGGLSSQGLTAAGGVQNGLQNLSNANSASLGNIGQAQAGTALGIGNANAGMANGIAGALGTALGAFGGGGGGLGSLAGGFGGAQSPVTGLNSGVSYPMGGGLF